MHWFCGRTEFKNSTEHYAVFVELYRRLYFILFWTCIVQILLSWLLIYKLVLFSMWDFDDGENKDCHLGYCNV